MAAVHHKGSNLFFITKINHLSVILTPIRYSKSVAYHTDMTLYKQHILWQLQVWCQLWPTWLPPLSVMWKQDPHRLNSFTSHTYTGHTLYQPLTCLQVQVPSLPSSLTLASPLLSSKFVLQPTNSCSLCSCHHLSIKQRYCMYAALPAEVQLTRCQHAWVFSCTLILWQWLNYGHACYHVILFLLLMVTILEFFALSMLWGLRTLRGNLTSWSSTGEANQINIVDIDNELWTFSSSEVQSKVCLCKRQLLAPDGPQWNCSVYWRTQIVLTVEWSRCENDELQSWEEWVRVESVWEEKKRVHENCNTLMLTYCILHSTFPMPLFHTQMHLTFEVLYLTWFLMDPLKYCVHSPICDLDVWYIILTDIIQFSIHVFGLLVLQSLWTFLFSWLHSDITVMSSFHHH